MQSTYRVGSEPLTLGQCEGDGSQHLVGGSRRALAQQLARPQPGFSARHGIIVGDQIHQADQLTGQELDIGRMVVSQRAEL